MADRSAPPLLDLAQGAFLAGCWGALVESTVLLVAQHSSGLWIARGASLVRVAESALAAALVGVAAGLALLVLGRPRKWRAAGPSLVASTAGLAACAWLLLGVLPLPPAADRARLTADLVLGRLPRAGLVAVVTVAAAAAAVQVIVAAIEGRTRRRLALVVVAVAVVATISEMAAPRASVPAGRAPDILLLTVDTLRADHLGVYGYPLATSPAIDGLCRDGIVFSNAMAPTPATVPSYTSILTGLDAPAHGVLTNFDRAADSLTTVAERLVDAGYLTAAVLEGPLPGTFGNLHQGFDYVVQRGVTARSPVPCLSEALRSLGRIVGSVLADRLGWSHSVTTDAALSWLGEVPADRPLFLHVYWPYPHSPYAPPRRHLEALPAPAAATADPRVRDYDGEIHFTDAQVGRVLRTVAAEERFDGAWIVFTADHGEELGRVVQGGHGPGEPYFGHSIYLFDSSLHVPLCVRPPSDSDLKPRREPGIVTTTALAATMLEMAGLPAPDGVERPLPLAPAPAAPGRALSLAHYGERRVERISIRVDGWRLIDSRSPHPELLLLRHDASGEEEELAAADHPEVVQDLLDRLRRWQPPEGAARGRAAAAVSSREQGYLQALGYIE